MSFHRRDTGIGDAPSGLCNPMGTVVDWSDYLDESSPLSGDQRRMRMYIAAGLLGMGTLGLIGAMLHILPA